MHSHRHLPPSVLRELDIPVTFGVTIVCDSPNEADWNSRFPPGKGFGTLVPHVPLLGLQPIQVEMAVKGQMDRGLSAVWA